MMLCMDKFIFKPFLLINSFLAGQRSGLLIIKRIYGPGWFVRMYTVLYSTGTSVTVREDGSQTSYLLSGCTVSDIRGCTSREIPTCGRIHVVVW